MIPPEIPAPRPLRPDPDDPTPDVPAPVPVVPDDGALDPRHLLLRQRRVMLSGALDEDAATRVAAELMTLDGESSRPVGLIINSPGGPLDAALAVLDVLDLMRAPVVTRCVGRAAGTAAVVLAAGTAERAAADGALISLRLDERYEFEGDAGDVEQFAQQLAESRSRLQAHLRRFTALSDDEIAEQFASGASMSAEVARRHGIIDRVLRR